MPTLVRESFAFSGGAVDRAGAYPVIRNVLLCGSESAWGRRYLPEAFAGDRVKRYEGRPVNLNHSDTPGARDIRDRIGWIENARHNAAGMPVGDIGINPKHPEAESVLWAAEHKPDFCSMSHVADIDARPGAGGVSEVRECKSVESVDIVTTGATTRTMYSEGGRPVSQTVREYAAGIARRVDDFDKIARLKWLVKEEGYADAPMPADAPPADAADADAGISAAFEAAIMGVVRKAMSGDLDVPEAARKFKSLLKSHGDTTDSGDDEGDDDDWDSEGDDEYDDSGKAKEAVGDGSSNQGGQERAMNAKDPKAHDEDGDHVGYYRRGNKKTGKRRRAKESAPGREAAPTESLLSELVSEAFTPSATQLTALKGMKDAADRVAFIREQKGLANATRPRSTGRETPVKESAPPTGREEARLAMAAESARLRGVKPSAN